MSRAFLRRPDRSELFNSIPRVQESDTWSDKDKDEKYFFTFFTLLTIFINGLRVRNVNLNLTPAAGMKNGHHHHHHTRMSNSHDHTTVMPALPAPPFPPSVRGFILFISFERRRGTRPQRQQRSGKAPQC